MQKRSLTLFSLSSENRAYSEGRTEAGYIFFVLWERCFCIAANGIREEYLFPNASVYVLQVAHSGEINKLKKQKKLLCLIHLVHVLLRCG